MGHPPSRKSTAPFGTPLNFRVTPEVAAALLAEARRAKRTVDFMAAQVMYQWYELDYLPTQGKKK